MSGGASNAGAGNAGSPATSNCTERELVGQVDEGIKSVRQVFFVVLGAYAFYTITVVTLSGREVLERGRMVLPLIDLPVSFNIFFAGVPPLLLFASCYFYFHARFLFRRISTLEDDCKKQIVSWVVTNDWVKSSRKIWYLESHWVEMAMWHCWSLSMILSAIAAVRIQTPWILGWLVVWIFVQTLVSLLFRCLMYPASCAGWWHVYGFYLLVVMMGIVAVLDLSRASKQQQAKDGWRSRIVSVNCSNQIFGATGESLHAISASKRSLVNANFQYAKIDSLICEDCDLRFADFRGAKMRNCRFTRAKLNRANFQNATCTGCNFEDAVLVDALFVNADLSNSELDGANLHGTMFFQTNVSGVGFEASQAFQAGTFYLADFGADSSFLRDLMHNRPDLRSKFLWDSLVVE